MKPLKKAPKKAWMFSRIQNMTEMNSTILLVGRLRARVAADVTDHVQVL
jgi:hypothetical protein